MDCIFCKIIAGSIPSTKVFESEKVLGFQDLGPQAKTHLLFVHKQHDANVLDMARSHPARIGEVYQAIAEHAAKSGLEQSGLRVVTNVGAHAGQTVFHAHFHVVGGEKLGRFGR